MAVPDEAVARLTARYPPAQITPAEFENFITSLFDAIENDGTIANLQIKITRSFEVLMEFVGRVLHNTTGELSDGSRTRLQQFWEHRVIAGAKDPRPTRPSCELSE